MKITGNVFLKVFHSASVMSLFPQLGALLFFLETGCLSFALTEPQRKKFCRGWVSNPGPPVLIFTRPSYRGFNRETLLPNRIVLLLLVLNGKANVISCGI